MRKMTLRAYVELLRLEDRLRDHHFYVQTVKVAIEVCIVINQKIDTNLPVTYWYLQKIYQTE